MAPHPRRTRRRQNSKPPSQQRQSTAGHQFDRPSKTPAIMEGIYKQHTHAYARVVYIYHSTGFRLPNLGPIFGSTRIGMRNSGLGGCSKIAAIFFANSVADSDGHSANISSWICN